MGVRGQKPCQHNSRARKSFHDTCHATRPRWGQPPGTCLGEQLRVLVQQDRPALRLYFFIGPDFGFGPHFAVAMPFAVASH